MKLFNPTYIYNSVWEIEEDFFYRENISLVLLDIDNTLVADNEPYADDKAKAFIKRLLDEGIKVCFVSNNKKTRVDSFNESFGLYSIWRAHKPLPYKINAVIKKMNVDKSRVLFIGDQLLTDIPAGNSSKIRTMLVTPINTAKENLFFKFKRFIEKRVLSRDFI